jgi:hypothetical protein
MLGEKVADQVAMMFVGTGAFGAAVRFTSGGSSRIGSSIGSRVGGRIGSRIGSKIGSNIGSRWFSGG